MRPQQQNRRMRGRNNGGGGNNNNNNNNRKGPNPLTRSYESNGPDVKIRGSAQQIAEKYATLARDAMSSGDRVMAENYLQHAEHYNRIIAAAQAQFAQLQPQQNRDDLDDDLDDDGFAAEGGVNFNDSPIQAPPQQPPQQQVAQGFGPQPVIEGTPAEVAFANDGAPAPGGRRNHDRRPYHQQPRHEGHSAPQPATGPQDEQPAIRSEAAGDVASAGPNGEEQVLPRRGRRPRRGNRDRASDPAGEGEGGAPADGPTLATVEG